MCSYLRIRFGSVTKDVAVFNQNWMHNNILLFPAYKTKMMNMSFHPVAWQSCFDEIHFERNSTQTKKKKIAPSCLSHPVTWQSWFDLNCYKVIISIKTLKKTVKEIACLSIFISPSGLTKLVRW